MCCLFCPDVEVALLLLRMDPSRQLSLVAVPEDGFPSELRVNTFKAYICLREKPLGLPSRGRPVGGPTNSRCNAVMYNGGFFFALVFLSALSEAAGLDGGVVVAVAGEGPL